MNTMLPSSNRTQSIHNNGPRGLGRGGREIYAPRPTFLCPRAVNAESRLCQSTGRITSGAKASSRSARWTPCAAGVGRRIPVGAAGVCRRARLRRTCQPSRPPPHIAQFESPMRFLFHAITILHVWLRPAAYFEDFARPLPKQAPRLPCEHRRPKSHPRRAAETCVRLQPWISQRNARKCVDGANHQLFFWRAPEQRPELHDGGA